jgi:hypothetical protein
VELDAERNTATIPLAFAPQTLRLDPDMRVWRRLQASQLPPILRQWMAGRSPQLVDARAGGAPGGQATGRAIVREPARITGAGPAEQRPERQNPVLLAGTHAEVDQALAGAGLPARPASLAGKGSAQVWTVPGQPYPLAVISAQDAAALNALQRGLPHYGKAGWFSSRARHRQRHLAGRHP